MNELEVVVRLHTRSRDKYRILSKCPTSHCSRGNENLSRFRSSWFREFYSGDSDRNVDLYHWSSAKFSSTWYDTLSVLVAKGRAQVGVAASSGDWSKRIRDMQYTDHEDYTVGS